jgi:hypothetical protein
MLQEELAGERIKAFPVYELREELHPSVPAQYPSCSGRIRAIYSVSRARPRDLKMALELEVFSSISNLLGKKIGSMSWIRIYFCFIVADPDLGENKLLRKQTLSLGRRLNPH